MTPAAIPRWRMACVTSLVTVALAFVVHRALSAGDQQAPAKYRPISGVEKFKDYRRWTKVNPRPVYMEPLTVTLCASPTQAQKEFDRRNPHTKKFLTVYVNSIGKKAMLEQMTPIFPVGSIIVKEKLAKLESKQPELLTAMIKRERGYDSANGDWEYLVLNGTATKIDAGGKLANCQSCHVAQKGMDYIFGTYRMVVPADKKVG